MISAFRDPRKYGGMFWLGLMDVCAATLVIAIPRYFKRRQAYIRNKNPIRTQAPDGGYFKTEDKPIVDLTEDSTSTMPSAIAADESSPKGVFTRRQRALLSKKDETAASWESLEVEAAVS